MEQHKHMKKGKKNTKRMIAVAAIAAAVMLLLLLLRFCGRGGHTLYIADVRAEGIESEVVADVCIDKLGDAIYPAASFIIDFDASRLELLSVNEGNVFVSSENGEKLPEWSVNVNKANETGEIRIMYLDITAGTQAFSDELAGKDGVLFRLKFRVRGSARAGDVYRLVVEDAVFAANDEELSLATKADTLKVRNGSIVIEAH